VQKKRERERERVIRYETLIKSFQNYNSNEMIASAMMSFNEIEIDNVMLPRD